MTGESTLCTLLSSTKISLEKEDQGHHSQASPTQFLTFFFWGGCRGRKYEVVLEPLGGRSEVCDLPRKETDHCWTPLLAPRCQQAKGQALVPIFKAFPGRL